MSDLIYPVAPIWRRMAALVYDTFILLALSMLYGAITAAVYVAIYGKGQQDFSPMMSGWLFRLGWFLTLAAFYVYFWRRAGQTAGMRAWQLKLVSKNGQQPRLAMCIVRAITAPIVVLAFGLGYFWALLDKSRHCLHDRISNTSVLVIPKH